MNNKELFQEKNDRLDENNNDLKDILEKINNLPNKNKINLQEKTISPTTYTQEVISDSAYDGLSKVKINAVDSSIDSDIKPENIKKGVEILGVIGNAESGSAEPVLQSKSVEPSTGKQIITADSGYDGLGQVTVNAVTSRIDSNIKADNIKQGVSILGVEGNLEVGAEVVKKYRPKFISFRSSPAIDLSEETRMLDTSLMTSMDSMFSSSHATNIDVSEWDTSNVTTMASMFSYASDITSLNLSNFNTINVKSMTSMFRSCSGLTYLDLSNFNTTSIDKSDQGMSSMFYGCSSLVELNISNFTISQDLNISSMFYDCRKLQKIDARNMNFSTSTSYSYMFENVPTTCLIIVKDDTEKSWVQKRAGSSYTNIKTLAEYQAEGGV